MEFILIGIAVAFNILIVLWKFQHNRILDGFVDGTLLVAVAALFSGSTALLIIGTIGSLIVSIYLLFSPIKAPKLNANSYSSSDLAARLDRLLD